MRGPLLAGTAAWLLWSWDLRSSVGHSPLRRFLWVLKRRAAGALSERAGSKRNSEPLSGPGNFPMSKDVIIVGAGPGGLASAVLLAAAGVKVKVIERLPIIGGRTSSIEADGFKFDLGPTFFLYPRVLEEIFATAGTTLGAEVEMVRLDPQYRIVFGEGGELHASPDIKRMEQQIAAIAPDDAPGFGDF